MPLRQAWPHEWALKTTSRVAAGSCLRLNRNAFAVIKKRQLWIVRNIGVVPELHMQRIPVADVGEGLFARRDANAGGLFHQAFNRLYLMCFHYLALDRGGFLSKG